MATLACPRSCALSEGRSDAPSGVGQSDHNATVTVTRVVDGDTIDISPSVKGRSRVRLIGMDTPEVYFGTQSYGPEASAFAKRELDGQEVKLELDVQKIDPYGRPLAPLLVEAPEPPGEFVAVVQDAFRVL
jgi:endonuclease YncB( thermonuclease family)